MKVELGAASTAAEAAAADHAAVLEKVSVDWPWHEGGGGAATIAVATVKEARPMARADDGCDAEYAPAPSAALRLLL